MTPSPGHLGYQFLSNPYYLLLEKKFTGYFFLFNFNFFSFSFETYPLSWVTTQKIETTKVSKRTSLIFEGAYLSFIQSFFLLCSHAVFKINLFRCSLHTMKCPV